MRRSIITIALVLAIAVAPEAPLRTRPAAIVGVDQIPVDLAAVDRGFDPSSTTRADLTDAPARATEPPSAREGRIEGGPTATTPIDGGGASPHFEPAQRCADGGLAGRTLDVAIADRRDGWLRGDLTEVVELPDGRRLWLFGDTYWGSKRSDGGIDDGWRLSHSSVVVEHGGCFDPVDDAHPTGWIPNVIDGILWPHQAAVVGDELIVFAASVVRDPDHGPPGLDFRSNGGAIVRYDLSDLTAPETMRTDVPAIDGHPFTRGVSTHRGHLYAYAHVPETGTHAARVAISGTFPRSPMWEFWDGTAWDPDVTASQPVSSERLRVWPSANGWRALSLPILGTALREFVASAPTGPYDLVAAHPIPATTEPGLDMWSYEPLHVGVDPASDEFGYNTLPVDPDLVLEDLTRYGPQLITVDAPGSRPDDEVRQ